MLLATLRLVVMAVGDHKVLAREHPDLSLIHI